MKKLLSVVAIFAIAVMALGVNKCDVSDPLAMLAVKNASRALGYAVAQSKTTIDDSAVVAAYDLLTKGQLNEVSMTELLSKMQGQNPLLVFAALDLLEAMGAMINREQGTILDLSPIPAEMWPVVEIAYKQGYALGKADKKAGVTRAVP